MKTCTTCLQTMPDSGFYLTGKGAPAAICKECAKARARENYRAHVAQYKEYERSRAMAPHRVDARERYQQTDKGKAAVYRGRRKYETSEHGKAAIAASRRSYRMNNPFKRAAHILVGNAIRAGKLTRQSCEVCGGQSAQAHHDDYSKPLDVRWLCTTHHAEWHKHNTPLCPDQNQEKAA
jgi:hypothetical protein